MQEQGNRKKFNLSLVVGILIGSAAGMAIGAAISELVNRLTGRTLNSVGQTEPAGKQIDPRWLLQ
jgi:hypothetical protein